MNNDDKSLSREEIATVLPTGFGERLRQAREQRDMSVEDVGQRLRIPVRVLRQLENDDLSGIDTPLYLRGYLRAYTSLLEIEMPEGEMRDAQLAVTPLPLETSGGISHGRYLFARLSTAATYLAITALIVVPTVWLGLNGGLQRDIAQLVPLDGPTDENRQAGELIALPDPIADVSVDKGPLKASMSPSFLFADPMVEKGTPAGSTEASETVAPVEVEPVVPRAAENLAQTAAVQNPGGVAIQLVLRQPSWVEVTDARGSRIEYALLAPGKYRYSGQQALDILIGNARSADVYSDGQQLDVEEYRHGDLAKFRVDGSRGLTAPTGET